MIFSKNLKALREGRPCPCWFDSNCSEITARGDWKTEPLPLRFQMKWNNSKGRPNVVGIRLNVSSARSRHCDGCQHHSVFPCCYFTSFENVTAGALVFSLPLLLFHSIRNRISKGKVSPPSSPLGFWEIWIYIYIYKCIYIYNIYVYIYIYAYIYVNIHI